MNYLAHLYLADPDDGHRLGNLAGDWIKGRLEGQAYPQRVLDGVRRHRFVDSCSDRHPAALVARRRLGPDRRRASGIILDMVNDHFLVRHWPAYATTPLPRFLRDSYASVERMRPYWPDHGVRVMDRIITDDWLSRYEDLDVIALALERIAGRMRRDPGLSGTLPLLRREYTALEEQFHVLMDDLCRACASPE
ncbi:ACP phosphodiesterase [Aquisalimonas lutea]|uniref:acyl carrier protein phosphodiesterase n=1 Tax=Aquisalimonas lutea TaxID=1327750 RepID=UPI0025B2EC41|nr:ACP phosphodiesterase [Aquisalimonas lutea]MDN3518269.1 ACP phosphodiesterase [Aquisalimonas lutea]